MAHKRNATGSAGARGIVAGPRASISEATAPELQLGNSIGYQLHQTDKVVEAAMQRRLNRFDVPIGMYFYLRVLWLEDGLGQAELSRKVNATSATTALQLRRMEDRGLIRRAGDPADKRKVHVHLTDAGWALQEPLLKEAMANRADALRDFKDAERRQILSLLDRIQVNIARSDR